MGLLTPELIGLWEAKIEGIDPRFRQDDEMRSEAHPGRVRTLFLV